MRTTSLAPTHSFETLGSPPFPLPAIPVGRLCIIVAQRQANLDATSAESISGTGSTGNRSTDERFDESSGDTVREHRAHADTESAETDSRHNDEAHEASGHAAGAHGARAERTHSEQNGKRRKHTSGELCDGSGGGFSVSWVLIFLRFTSANNGGNNNA